MFNIYTNALYKISLSLKSGHFCHPLPILSIKMQMISKKKHTHRLHLAMPFISSTALRSYTTHRMNLAMKSANMRQTES